MSRCWEPGTQYNYNDVVSYNGSNYKIIQPHRSQGDWAPDMTPALWGRIPDNNNYQNNNYQNQCPPQQQYGQQQGQQQYYQPPPQQYNQPPPQQPQPPSYQPPPPSNDEKQSHHGKHDSGSDDGKKGLKTVLGIGGAILGGAALLGVGVAAKKHHDDKEGMQSWLEDARYRTQAYRNGQGSGPVAWVLSEGRNIPQDAIAAGHDSNVGTLFIARGFHRGSNTPGKASSNLKTGATIGWAHDEINLEKYEVLVGNPNSVRWIPVSGKLKLSALGARPVDGGVDCNGSQLYCARAHFKGGVHPGKVGEHLKCAFIPYGDDEEETHSYEVLCYSF